MQGSYRRAYLVERAHREVFGPNDPARPHDVTRRRAAHGAGDHILLLLEDAGADLPSHAARRRAQAIHRVAALERPHAQRLLLSDRRRWRRLAEAGRAVEAHRAVGQDREDGPELLIGERSG